MEMSERVVKVAEGCIESNIGFLRDLLEKARNTKTQLIIHASIIPDLGCGELLAIVGPRGGVRGVAFVANGELYWLNRTLLRAFKPSHIYDKKLYEKIMKRVV